MPLGYFFLTHWRKLVWVTLVLVLMAPFVLAHLVVFVARWFEPRLPNATAVVLNLPGGRVRIWRGPPVEAAVTMVYIHGTPLNVPVLMVHGGQDGLVPVRNVDYLEKTLEAAGKIQLFHKRVYPEDNHFIPWKHPEAMTPLPTARE